MIRLDHPGQPDFVRRARSVIVVLATVAASAVAPVSAQTLTYALFERYLESYREQFGIPAVSVAIVQGGALVWEAGLGKQDVEANINASADTPYYIGTSRRSSARRCCCRSAATRTRSS